MFLWVKGRVQQLTGLKGLSIGLSDSFRHYPVEQNGSDCRLLAGDTQRIWQQFPYYQCYLTYTIGQLRYTYIDQNLQLHVICTIQFANSSRTTKHIVNTTSRDLQLVWIGIKNWSIKNGPVLSKGPFIATQLNSTSSWVELRCVAINGPLAESCPTADRSRKMARKWTGELLDTLLVPVPPGVQCKGPLNNYYVLCCVRVSYHSIYKSICFCAHR